MAVKPRSEAEVTISRLVQYLSPGAWFDGGKVPDWPPDIFAFAASLLRHSGAYIEIVNRWPPEPFATADDWLKEIESVASEWRECINADRPPPDRIARWWGDVKNAADTAVSTLSNDRRLVESLINLLSSADACSAGIGIVDEDSPTDLYYDEALTYLEGNQSGCNSLCRQIHASAAIVLPKLHTPLSGLTLRSLSHHLALWERQEVRPLWRQVTMPALAHGMNLLVIPWPLSINPQAFRSIPASGVGMSEEFGLFKYTPMAASADFVKRVTDLEKEAATKVGRIDGLIFPELSVSKDDFPQLTAALPGRLVVAGVGGDGPDKTLGLNAVMVGYVSEPVNNEETQHKHHRWRLDAGQIEQYGLGCGLDSQKKWWWEAIALQKRDCTFFSVNSWCTFCVLICEDLARQDPVAELVRTVGPNLVIGLLMDGPQLSTRWSARYATVLADDPRCSVLTVTSAALVDLTHAQGLTGRRSIALWKDALSREPKEIILGSQSEAVVLTLSREWAEEWSADGRSDGGKTGHLRLSGVHQVGRLASQ